MQEQVVEMFSRSSTQPLSSSEIQQRPLNTQAVINDVFVERAVWKILNISASKQVQECSMSRHLQVCSLL